MTYSTSRDFAPRLNLVRTESHQGQHAHTLTRRDPLSAEKVKDVGLWVTLLSKALSVAGWKITNQLLQFRHLWSNPGATTALAASLQRVLHDRRSTDSVVTSRLKVLLCHDKIEFETRVCSTWSGAKKTSGAWKHQLKYLLSNLV